MWEGATQGLPAARGVILEAGCRRLFDNKETCRGPWRSDAGRVPLRGESVSPSTDCTSCWGPGLPVACSCCLALPSGLAPGWFSTPATQQRAPEQPWDMCQRTQSGDEASYDQGGRRGFSIKLFYFIFKMLFVYF